MNIEADLLVFTKKVYRILHLPACHVQRHEEIPKYDHKDTHQLINLRSSTIPMAPNVDLGQFFTNSIGPHLLIQK